MIVIAGIGCALMGFVAGMAMGCSLSDLKHARQKRAMQEDRDAG